MTNTTLSSPAKINRDLYIKEFSEEHQKHRLESVLQKISLFDVIKISEIPENSEISGKNQNTILTITGKFSKGVPNDERNIVLKAIDMFFKKHNITKNTYKIVLEKNIPNEAGLGGGSSNAGEILKFLHQQYSLPLVPSEYISLGSDVPFFLENFSVGKLSGIGEKISEISDVSEKYNEKFGVLIFPKNIKISTAWAFQKFKKSIPKPNKSENPQKQSAISYNDFTQILCQKIPEISEILSQIQKISQKNIPEISEYGISGSGSTIYVLFSSQPSQEKFLEKFQKSCSISVELQKFEPLPS